MLLGLVGTGTLRGSCYHGDITGVMSQGTLEVSGGRIVGVGFQCCCLKKKNREKTPTPTLAGTGRWGQGCLVTSWGECEGGNVKGGMSLRTMILPQSRQRTYICTRRGGVCRAKMGVGPNATARMPSTRAPLARAGRMTQCRRAGANLFRHDACIPGADVPLSPHGSRRNCPPDRKGSRPHTRSPPS